jgi:hypothetical protein
VVRITPIAVEPIEVGMSPFQWALYAATLIFMAYTEGYRGFQRNFSPRVVARVLHLARQPQLLHVLLAPAFCMALFHATRRRLIVAWAVLLCVVLLVAGVRGLAQPWRGIIDGGVVVGLSWGLIAIAVYGARALGGKAPATDPGIPTV